MSLKLISEQLATAGVRHKIVTAMASKKYAVLERIERFVEDKDPKNVKAFHAAIRDPDMNLAKLAKLFPHDFPHGVEYADLTHRRSGKEIRFGYLNTGDTYNDTVLRNPISGKLEMTTMGDMVEYLGTKGYELV